MKFRNFILHALDFKPRKGFTLIELLVVMAIIVIISGLSLANWRGGERQYALLRAASKLSQDIRRVENFAMSAREFQNQIPEGGYGVYFESQEPDHYILFADLNGNQHYDAGSDGLVEDVKIEKDIQISQLSGSPLIVTFTPPFPTVTIKPDASTATITLAIKNDPTKTKAIEVNRAGLVYVETQLAGTCLTCYPDADRDGYYSASGSQSCGLPSCPSGYSETPGNDCYDENANARPGQTAYFSSQRGDGSFDYNCDGQEEKNQNYNCLTSLAVTACTSTRPSGTAGYVGSVPVCGGSDTFRRCYSYWNTGCGFWGTPGGYCGAGCRSGGWRRSWKTSDTSLTMPCR